ncbi:hypothetical protein [Paenibacillus silagei]|uniref:ParB/Sulfiredoxin domain-containing protein n=1 Tax=Paenibacillus silagei TaxID=1670801 RepID=A0ABS4NWH8_9BACL|nr:hypothetical protein [Paenibacillus silagei]MBP2114404.1 hypothetical protein [Paenibacillus silagei]
MRINHILTDYFCESHNIDLNKEYEIEEIDASDLIVSERIDLIAKIKYIEFREKGYDLTYIKKLYSAHIEAFSDGTYIEPGNEAKNSIEDYLDTFDSLIDDIKKQGINPDKSVIPVGKNNTILDGAHRIAIAAYFKQKVPVIRFNDLSVSYGTSFFENRLLDNEYIDYLVTEYCKIKKNIYFSCIWPVVYNEMDNNVIEELIGKYATLIYKKKVKLSYEGLQNFMIQIYSSQQWTGNLKNRYSGIHSKVEACFNKHGYISVYILECKDGLEKILELKSDIRKVFNVENHSIHITDNDFETVQICNLLLNENSIDFLNNGNPLCYLEFCNKISSFKDTIINYNLSLEEFLVDSSASLALYGLRDAADIDFMTIASEFKQIESNDINNHHKYIKLYETSIDDLVLNPNNFFSYNDVKFITLKKLREFKKNRDEIKDRNDVRLIDVVLSGKKHRKMNFYKFKHLVAKKHRNIKSFIKFKIKKILKAIGLFELFKKFYHSIMNRVGKW